MAGFNSDSALANFDAQTGSGPGGQGALGYDFNTDDALANFDTQTGSGLGGSGKFGYNFNTDDALFEFDTLTSPYSFGGPSTGIYGNPASPNTTGWGQFSAKMDDFFNNNKFGKIAGVALNFSPVGKAFNAARGINSALTNGNFLGAGLAALGAANPAMGGLARAGLGASQGNFAPAGGYLGSMFGGMVGGRAGSMIGGQLGSYVGNQASRGGAPGESVQTSGPDLGGIAEGLVGLYGNRGGGEVPGASAANQAVQQQIQDLRSMFTPNSPYAQQLRQTLERKDAAAGRRSQYGPREVQLQAALADKAAGVSDTMGRLATSNQANQAALQKQKLQQRGQTLATIMNMGKQSGVFQGLGDMFNDARGATPYADRYNYGAEPLEISTPMGGNPLSNPSYFYPTEWNSTVEY